MRGLLFLATSAFFSSLIAVGCKPTAPTPAGDSGAHVDQPADAALESSTLPTNLRTEQNGRWVVLTSEGRFKVAICAVGEKPELGSLGSPEHSATRDESIAKTVPCPAPLPDSPPPAVGDRALSFANVPLFPTTAGDEHVDAGGAREPGSSELVTVLRPGEHQSEVKRANGEAVRVDNARLLTLDGGRVRNGDFVVAFHPEVGLLRAVVTSASPSPNVLRLNGFGDGIFGELKLAPGTFRIIRKELDAGSLVAIPLADRVELAMVLRVAGTMVMLQDNDGRLRAVHRSTIVPMPLRPNYQPGMKIYAPFVNDLTSGKVKRVDPNAAEISVVWDSFPDGDETAFGFGSVIDRDLSLHLYKSF